PYHSINPAIRSRCHLFELHVLQPKNIKVAIKHALEDRDDGLGQRNIEITEDALDHFALSSNGDMRSALNGLELAHFLHQKTMMVLSSLICKPLKSVCKRKISHMTKMVMPTTMFYQHFKNQSAEVMSMLHFIT